MIDPILDYRDEQRRTQPAPPPLAGRRRFVALAVAVGAVMAVVLTRLGDDEPAPRPLAIGERSSGVVDGGRAGVRFALDVPPRTATVVTVSPEDQDGAPIDFVIELASSTGRTRLEDRSGPGNPEKIVVPANSTTAGTAILRVSSLNSAARGSFSIMVEALDVTDVAQSSTREGRIVDPGSLLVYRVDSDGPTPMLVDVAPPGDSSPFGEPVDVGQDPPAPEAGDGGESQKESKRPTELDVNIEVIDPAGIATRVDTAGPEGRERFVLSGGAGSYLVVVRGYQTTVGDFTITASESCRSIPVSASTSNYSRTARAATSPSRPRARMCTSRA